MINKTWRIDWDIAIGKFVQRITREDTMLDRFKLITSALWAFLAPFVKMFLSRAGKALLPIALQVVREVAASYGDSSGSVKREIAFTRIKMQLAQELPGIAQEVGASMINSAIEVAVQKLRAEG